MTAMPRCGRRGCPERATTHHQENSMTNSNTAPETDDTWVYPAPAWRHGDRVAIEDSSRDDYDETGTVIGPDPYDDGAWLVRLDDGTETSAYAHELTGIYPPAPTERTQT
ncbi:hypothetical protein [Actinosynnema sp. NPDC023587]|uniref:hypothetical protein n=1 Tax=Actinosynnema sp. NPDC023587 TaxID=3154695 RepID=UPI0033CF4302